jgi:hypothetical protein
MSLEATGGPLARLAHAINTARQLTQAVRGRGLPPERADTIAELLREAQRTVRRAADSPQVRQRTNKPTHRRRLWRRDPHCFWCGRLTVFEAYGVPHAATIEHIYPRGHPKRRSPRKVLPETVLACHACNQERGGYAGTASGEACPVVTISRS